jgi:DNA-binding LytR/AlgR family response regulator
LAPALITSCKFTTKLPNSATVFRKSWCLAREVIDHLCVLAGRPPCPPLGEVIAVNPTVIFVTAYDQYALRAFEAYALDYLLKPFNRARFRRAVEPARLQIARESRDQVDKRLAALLRDARTTSRYMERLVIRSAGRVVFLRSDDVDWFGGCANYLQLHVGKSTHLMREKISALETRLDPSKFIRIHRSCIVNIDRIKEMRSSGDGEQLTLALRSEWALSSTCRSSTHSTTRSSMTPFSALRTG